MKIICPSCQAIYNNVPEHYLNKSVNCKKCQHRFIATEADTQPELSSEPQETQLQQPADASEASAEPQETVLAPDSNAPQETVLAADGNNLPQETCLASAQDSQSEYPSVSPSAEIIILPQQSTLSEITQTGSQYFLAQRNNDEQTLNEWRIGDVLLDLYEIQSLLGEGQFGKVYHVRHRTWNMDLAVKSPKPRALAAGFDTIEREAETWVNLDLHPNIVNCYYVRRIDGIPQIFSEYVDGGDLKTFISSEKLYQGNSSYHLARLLDIAVQFAWGLHSAHEQGLIHQDIKPANVMVSSDGTIKVTDFGLAKAGALANLSGQENHQTVVIAGMGMTPAYASPEQLANKALTRRTDLWSWAVCVLEMILGYCSWESGSVAPEIFEAYLNNELEETPRIETIPDGLIELLRRCFAIEEEHRPDTLLEVAKQLVLIYPQVSGESYSRQQPGEGGERASSLNNQAISLLDLGQSSDALKLWETSLKLDPMHFESTFNSLLYAWKHQGMTESEVLSKLDGFAKNERVKRGLARLYLQFGLYDKTIELLQGTVAQQQDTASEISEHNCKELGLAMCAKFRLVTSVTRWDKIAGFLKRSIGRTITDPYAITAYTVALQKCNKKKEAAQFFKAATSVGVIPKQLKLAVSLFLPGYGVVFRYAHKHIDFIEFIDENQRILFSSGNKLMLLDIADNKLVKELQGHISRIAAVAVSENEHKAVSVSEDGQIRVWNLLDHSCENHWLAHHKTINALDISPCGRYLVSVSSHKTVALWDIETGKKVPGFFGAGHETEIRSVKFSPNGKLIATAGNDKVIRIWKTENGRSINILSGHKMPVECVQWFNKDTLISAGHDKLIKIWRINDGQCLKTLRGHEGTINDICIAYQKNYLITAGSDGFIRYWDINTGSSYKIHQFSRPVNRVVLDNAEQFILTATGSGIALLESDNPFRYQASFLFCQPESAAEVDKLQQEYQHLLTQAFSARTDDNMILAMEFLLKARSIKGYEREPSAFDHWSALYSKLPRKKLRDLWQYLELGVHRERISDVITAGNTGRIISSGHDGTLQQINCQSREQQTLIFSCQQGIDCLAATQNPQAILVACDEKIHMVDIKTGESLSVFSHHSGHIRQIAVTMDGRFALSVDDKGAFYLWRLMTGDLMSEFTDKRYQITTLAITPDGRHAVTGHMNNNDLAIWNLETGRVESELSGHEKLITNIMISFDGRYIVSASADTTIRLWQFQSSRKESIRTFRGHHERIHQIAIDLQNKIIASVSEDKTLRIWNIINGECLHTFELDNAVMNRVVISPDAKYLITGDKEGKLRVWCLDWLLDKKQFVEWDNEANVYINNFLAARNLVEPHQSLSSIYSVLSLAGFGWLDKNETGLKIAELAETQNKHYRPGSKSNLSMQVERKSNVSSNKQWYFLAFIFVMASLSLLFIINSTSNKDNKNFVQSEQENTTTETAKLSDENEKKTLQIMFNIAQQIASLNKRVVFINQQVDVNSLTIPSDWYELSEMLTLADEDFKDAWGQTFHYQGVKLGLFKGRIVLRSAGKDQQFKTEDDLLLSGFPYYDSLEIKQNNQRIAKLSDYRQALIINNEAGLEQDSNEIISDSEISETEILSAERIETEPEKTEPEQSESETAELLETETEAEISTEEALELYEQAADNEELEYRAEDDELTEIIEADETLSEENTQEILLEENIEEGIEESIEEGIEVNLRKDILIGEDE